MANKKQQRKAQKLWKKKHKKAQNVNTTPISNKKSGGSKKDNISKAVNTHAKSTQAVTSMSAEFERALTKDRQERERRINLKAEQTKAHADEQERNFQEKRAEQDKYDREKADRLEIGSIILGQVEALIDAYPTPGSNYLKNLLKSEISRFGSNAVVYSLASAPDDIIELARTVVYYEEDSIAVHRALENFSHAIRGALPSESEAKELGDIMDSMTHLNSEYED